MYCLESITVLHPLVAPFALLQNGDQREKTARGGQDIVERAPIFNKRARRISCLSQIPDFLALTKYKWARYTSRDTRFVPIPHAYRKSERRLRSEKNARKQDERERKRREEKWIRKTPALFFHDQGCSVICLRGSIDPARPFDPQID